jgi:hypothetical protein
MNPKPVSEAKLVAGERPLSGSGGELADTGDARETEMTNSAAARRRRKFSGPMTAGYLYARPMPAAAVEKPSSARWTEKDSSNSLLFVLYTQALQPLSSFAGGIFYADNGI